MPPRWMLWSAATVSLAVGAWLSMSDDRLWDFTQVMTWAGDWRAGRSPFNADAGADYPPWALVTLAPILWLPDGLRAPVWIALNLALVGVIVRVLTRGVPGDETRRWLVPALLCVASFRTLSQFSVLSLALALAGATTRSPLAGGVWLGLALMKPQVGGVIWFALVCLRDWRRVAVAAALCVLLTLVAAWGLHQSPLRVLVDYAGVIGATHGGSTPFLGHTELEAWLWDLFAAGTTVPVAMALAIALLVPGVIGVLRRPPIDRAGIFEWFGYCGVVSLLATRHLSYDLMLLLPVVVAWAAWPARRMHAAGLFVLCWLILHPPTIWRRVLEPMGTPEGFGFISELDRVLGVGIWVVLAYRLLRRSNSVLLIDNR